MSDRASYALSYGAQELSDLECIRDVARRYCRGVDRLDEALMKSAYWPEATDNHGVFVGNAHEFVELCMASHQRYEATGHCIFNHSIELNGDGTSASGEIYNVTWLLLESQVDTWYGRYLDRYEKRGQEWRIRERVCVHEGSNSQPRTPMTIEAHRFVQGHVDRAVSSGFAGPDS